MTEQSTCQQCGRAIDAGAQFCANCGYNVSMAQSSLATRMLAPSTAQMQDVLLEQLREATLGEYEILTELGRGGMATVYLGHDLQLDRKVAVKVMLPDLLRGEGMIERFKLEARTAAALSHPHIIPIYAVRDAENLLYFIMKFVEGRPLDSIVKELTQVPIPMVQSIFARVGEALGYAHRRGVVHRDIKPANLMIDIEGLPVVTDFGIAKVSDKRGLTMTGATIGTPTYMSPEQCAATTITGASDQYSLAVVAYEMLSGRLPFAGDSIVSLLYKHVHEPPPPFMDARPDCPPALHDAVMKMLSKNPADRFPSMEAAVHAVGSVTLSFDDPVRTKLIELAKQGANMTILKRVSTPRSLTPPASRSGRTGTPAKRTGTMAQRTGTQAQRTGTPAQRTGTMAQRTGPSSPTVRVTTESPGRGRLAIGVTVAVLAVAGVGLGIWRPWQPRSAPSQPPTPAGIASLSVEPGSGAVSVNGTIQLAAAARDSAGQRIETPVTWTSENPGIATVSPAGVVSGLAPGEARIVASAGGTRAVAVLSVAAAAAPPPPGSPPATVARLRIDGAPATFTVGSVAALRALAFDGRGSALGERPVTWSSSNAAVASVSAAGLISAVTPGEATLTARSGTVSQTVRLQVAARAPGPAPAPRPASVAVTGAPGSLTPGQTARLSATVTGDDGRPMNTSLVWRSANTGVATVSDGVVTAVAAGSTTITAAADDRVGTVTVTVAADAPRPAPPPPPPPAAPEVDARDAITAVVQSYARALESKQMADVRRVYPSMSSEQERQTSDALRPLEQLQVTLRVSNLEVQGDIATATVGGTYEFRENRRTRPLAVSFQATFERGPSGWRIRSMR